MIRVGRYTAALLLLTVGVLLIVDLSLHTRYIAGIVAWWPVLLIMFGGEFLIANVRGHGEQARMRVDFGSLFFSVLISVIVIAATQASTLNLKFLDHLDIRLNPFELSDESGAKFAKDLIEIPLSEAVKQVNINNENGSVEIRSGDVAAMEIRATVFVSGAEDEAQQIADESSIAYSSGSTLEITAQGKEYKSFGLKRKARMNLEIIIPRASRANMNLHLTNGKIGVDGIGVAETLKARTVNGDIILTNIDGSVAAETTNGSVSTQKITGNVELKSVNGSVMAEEVNGTAKMDTTNGKIGGNRLGGAVTAESTIGNIMLSQVNKSIDAKAVSGSIHISSQEVGGNWKLDATLGSIKLNVPENGDFRVSASSGFGKAAASLPLDVSEKEISGTIGKGTYQIHIDAGGSVTVDKNE